MSGAAAWGIPVQLSGNGDAGSGNSVAMINGNLAISYYDEGNGDLAYVLLIE